MAVIAAAATLLSGAVIGLNNSWADGDDWWVPGTGGKRPAAILWKYKDSGGTGTDGSWGDASYSAADKNNPSVKAVEAAGIEVISENETLDDGSTRLDNGFQKLADAQNGAYKGCVERFNHNHPDQIGNAQCRVVGVGVVFNPSDKKYNGTGKYAGSGWRTAWNTVVAPYTYNHNNQDYQTSYAFADNPSRSVNSLMEESVSAGGDEIDAIVIVLDQYEPLNPEYELGSSTRSSVTGSVTAGGTDTVTDTVTLTCKTDGGCAADKTVDGRITLHWRGFDGQTAEASQDMKGMGVPQSKDATTDTTSPGFTPSSLGMGTWNPGYYWFDFDIAKTQYMKDPVHHGGETDAAESWKALIDLTISTDGTANTADMYGDGADSDDTVADTVTLSCGSATCPSNITVKGVTVTLHTPDGDSTGYPTQTVKDMTLGSTERFEFKRGKRMAAWTAGSYWFEASVNNLDTNMFVQSSVSHNADASVPGESFSKTFTGNADTKASETAPLVEDSTDAHSTSDSVTVTACEGTGQGSYCDPTDVKGTATLTFEPLDGEKVSVSKSVTVSLQHVDGDKDNPLSGASDVSFVPSDLGLGHWASGRYSYDVLFSKADNPILTADVSHRAADDSDEVFYVVPRPSKTWAHVGARVDAFDADSSTDSSTDSSASDSPTADSTASDSATADSPTDSATDSATSDSSTDSTDEPSDDDLIDADWTNQTAGDRDVYANGTRMASAATSDIPLKWLDGGFTLTDDWTNADTIFTADATEDNPTAGVTVYELTDPDSQNPVRDGKDVTSMFDITVDGHSVKAVTNDSYKAPDGVTHARYALVVKGTAKYDTAALAPESDGELTFCSVDANGHAVKGNGSDDGQHLFTNVAGTGYVLSDSNGAPVSLGTNMPWVCGIIPPSPHKDVRYDVSGDSIDTGDVTAGSDVVYTLDSGVLDVADRKALGESWDSMGFTDALNELDSYSGKWAVYGLTADGKPGEENLIASDSTGSVASKDSKDSTGSGDSADKTDSKDSAGSTDSPKDSTSDSSTDSADSTGKADSTDSPKDSTSDSKDSKDSSGKTDSTKGDAMFTASYDESTRTLSIDATPAMLARLNDADPSLDGIVRFVAAFQVTRTGVGKVDNTFRDHVNKGEWKSNTVVTQTPEQTEGLAVEKYDVDSGVTDGDRDTEDKSLRMKSDSTRIAVLVRNTGTLPLRNLKLTDETLDQTAGQVADWEYPDGWDSLVLNPGESVTVTGTLSGVTEGEKHHDRATVTGDPVPVCQRRDADPWDDAVSVESCDCSRDGTVSITGGDGVPTEMSVGVDAGPIAGCVQPRVLSASDDWWGVRPAAPLPFLPNTGSAVGVLVAVAGLFALGAGVGVWARRRRSVSDVSVSDAPGV